MIDLKDARALSFTAEKSGRRYTLVPSDFAAIRSAMDTFEAAMADPSRLKPLDFGDWSKPGGGGIGCWNANSEGDHDDASRTEERFGPSIGRP